VKNTIILIPVLLFIVYINADYTPCAAGNPVLTDAGPYGGGDGTAENPYQIYTAEQMNEIGANPNDWNRNFILMKDIDLSEYKGETFNIIGSYTDNSNNHPFSGVFDGNNNTIKNFSYTSIGKDYIGIFGYVSGVYAHIKNLSIHQATASVLSLDFLEVELSPIVALKTVTYREQTISGG